MKLWVDDIRPAPKGWVWAKSYSQARRLLEQNDWNFDTISLDHDLGGEKTGYDLLCKIEERVHEYVNYAPFIGVHTANMAVREKMHKVANKINGKRLKGWR
jgi:hypothetical protein